jgi:ribonuclease P protein component
MIARKLRLPRTRIKFLLNKGKKIANEYFVLRYVLKKDQPDRFAVVISTAISTKAVERNYLRRQIYEIIRLNRDINPTADIICIGKKNLMNISYNKIEESLVTLFKKIC